MAVMILVRLAKSLGIQDTCICHFISRDMGYYPSYFQEYGTQFSIILLTFRDIHVGYLGKLMDICQFIRDAYLFYFEGFEISIPPPLYKPL